MKKNKEVMADEVIGMAINEYGEIVRNAGGEEIQFSAPIFTPPQENSASATQTEDVSVSFRVVNEPQKSVNSGEKKVSSVSNFELEKLKEEMDM